MLDHHPQRPPACLTVPGLGNSGPRHWQSLWEHDLADCSRVELGCWDAPVRDVWLGRLDAAVRAAPAPVLLVAHSLGCLAVAWWAGLLGASIAGSVRGALLVAPPDVDREGAVDPIARFAPTPRVPLPFPAIVVASNDDPYCAPARAAKMAADWRAEFVLVADAGHINAASHVGAWPEGQRLLRRLVDGAPAGPATVAPPAPSSGAPRPLAR